MRTSPQIRYAIIKMVAVDMIYFPRIVLPQSETQDYAVHVDLFYLASRGYLSDGVLACHMPFE
jgi:hypothetical protein